MLDLVLLVPLVVFMVGNLLDFGLRLKLQEALGSLRNVRFVVLSVLWVFVRWERLDTTHELLTKAKKP
jgi:bile acid:Na+ symporter, BASS family